MQNEHTGSADESGYLLVRSPYLDDKVEKYLVLGFDEVQERAYVEYQYSKIMKQMIADGLSPEYVKGYIKATENRLTLASALNKSDKWKHQK